MFVRGISEIAELRVSLRRLKAFLVNEEFVPVQLQSQTSGVENYVEGTKSAIKLDKFCAKWNKDNTDLALDNIYLDIPNGNLVGVIGPVGSGKSSLLQAVLGK